MIFTILPTTKGRENFVKLTSPLGAVAYYKEKKVDLLKGASSPSSLEELNDELKQIPLAGSFEHPRIIHLFYEWGYFYQDQESNIEANSLLALDITFAGEEKWTPPPFPQLALKKLREVSYSSYSKAFKGGREHLLRGNCYQFNLTYPFSYRLSHPCSMEQFLAHYWREREKIGTYAMATFVEPLGQGFISNTPELFFRTRSEAKKKKLRLTVAPIKGSWPLNNSSPSHTWNKLKKCPKNKGELDMITDLLRNDLSRIEKPVAQVHRRQVPLLVPGIVHQYSLISVLLGKKISLGRVLQCLFPSGSVTGAPKKKSMEILAQLESSPRGFYCGSSILLHNSRVVASVNIRSIVFSLVSGLLQIHAGGGITLQAHCREEFKELHFKKNSVLALFDKQFF